MRCSEDAVLAGQEDVQHEGVWLYLLNTPLPFTKKLLAAFWLCPRLKNILPLLSLTSLFKMLLAPFFAAVCA